MYHSQNDKQYEKIQNDWLSDSTQVIVATIAFGMGIDKPNIRYTIHFGIPSSIESFYQEAGRAGRDKKDSECFIIFSEDPLKWGNNLLDPTTPIEELRKKGLAKAAKKADRETAE